MVKIMSFNTNNSRQPNSEIKNYNDKLRFIEKQKESKVEFVLCSFSDMLVYFNLATIDEEKKIFFYIPFSGYLSAKEEHIAFQTNLKIEDLLKIIKVYKEKVESITEDQAKSLIE
ncbi:hypothetical protein ACNSOL_11535 (plasmid) [Aliarcobacter lanthieri]|uniref:hypothetical protein n=1 Tax=Aliarcobacter lanthieri TaxID=1355374 RepID=UPI003AAAD31D